MSYEKTHYDILEVRHDASVEAIRGAYKHLSQKWHPDKNKDNPEYAEKIFKQLNNAYSVLSNPESRRIYDGSITDKYGNSQGNTNRGTQKESTFNKEAESTFSSATPDNNKNQRIIDKENNTFFCKKLKLLDLLHPKNILRIYFKKLFYFPKSQIYNKISKKLDPDGKPMVIDEAVPYNKSIEEFYQEAKKEFDHGYIVDSLMSNCLRSPSLKNTGAADSKTKELYLQLRAASLAESWRNNISDHRAKLKRKILLDYQAGESLKEPGDSELFCLLALLFLLYSMAASGNVLITITIAYLGLASRSLISSDYRKYRRLHEYDLFWPNSTMFFSVLFITIFFCIVNFY